ncbi:MAG: phosphoribosylformylglycinamidine synthase subunit PurS [Bacteroidetes bacterium]|jgi:phosphoribosylformylglycinamidine synthase subunit PurS|nr:phosphoribosylformylglycinamidine synthase subunit PurS [Bacteroidota bacterium]
MTFRAEINVMPQKALLDPQGKTVHQSMHLLGLKDINNVRIGKHIMVELEAADEAQAKAQVEKACKELLANQVMEHYEYVLVQV